MPARTAPGMFVRYMILELSGDRKGSPELSGERKGSPSFPVTGKVPPSFPVTGKVAGRGGSDRGGGRLSPSNRGRFRRRRRRRHSRAANRRRRRRRKRLRRPTACPPPVEPHPVRPARPTSAAAFARCTCSAGPWARGRAPARCGRRSRATWASCTGDRSLERTWSTSIRGRTARQSFDRSRVPSKGFVTIAPAATRNSLPRAPRATQRLRARRADPAGGRAVRNKQCMVGASERRLP